MYHQISTTSNNSKQQTRHNSQPKVTAYIGIGVTPSTALAMVYIRELTEVLVVPHPEFGLETFKVFREAGDDTADIRVLIQRAIGIAHEAYVLISGGKLLDTDSFAPDAGVYMLPQHIFLQEDPLEK